MLVAASAEGVNVAVYEAPDPAKLDRVPPLRVMSPSIRFDVDSLEVNARAIVASLVVSPESTVDEVMVIVGTVASCVKANWVAAAVLSLPAASVIAPATTLMVTAWSALVGVNVYVQIVVELPPEPVPLPTDPPPRASVGASSSASEAVTITVYVASFPY